MRMLFAAAAAAAVLGFAAMSGGASAAEASKCELPRFGVTIDVADTEWQVLECHPNADVGVEGKLMFAAERPDGAYVELHLQKAGAPKAMKAHHYEDLVISWMTNEGQLDHDVLERKPPTGLAKKTIGSVTAELVDLVLSVNPDPSKEKGDPARARYVRHVSLAFLAGGGYEMGLNMLTWSETAITGDKYRNTDRSWAADMRAFLAHVTLTAQSAAVKP